MIHYIAPLIIIILISIWIHVPAYDKYLTGVWISDDQFAEDADITGMSILIGESEGIISRQRVVNIVILRGDQASNSSATMSYWIRPTMPTIGSWTINIHLNIDDPEAIQLPTNLTLTVDILTGILRLYKGDVLYARLHK